MARKIVLLAAAFLTVSVLRAQANGWDLEPSPTPANLYGVSFADPSTWIAVGDGGTILRSTDGGVGWSLIPSPIGDALRGVSFNGNIGLAVAIGGRILRSTDGGVTWVVQARPTHRNLYSVSIDSRMAVATGEEGGIFVSLDDGQTWVQHGAGTASIIFGVSANGDAGVGVGGQGAVVMSVDRGAGWGLTIIGTQLTFFYGVSLASPTTGWLVGTSDVVPSIIARTDNSGFTWTAQMSPTNQGLFGVSFASTSIGNAVGTNGAIIRTTDGQDWTVQSSGTTQTLNAVSLASSQLVLAVGDGGTILRTTTGGEDISGVDRARPSAGANGLSLEQNYPEPFASSTTIRFTLSRPGPASLRIFNPSGEVVATLAEGELAPGAHVMSWSGSGLPGGVYFVRLESGGLGQARKMVLAR